MCGADHKTVSADPCWHPQRVQWLLQPLKTVPCVFVCLFLDYFWSVFLPLSMYSEGQNVGNHMQRRSQPDLKQGCCGLRVKHLNAALLQPSGEKNCRLTTLFRRLGGNDANVGRFFFPEYCYPYRRVHHHDAMKICPFKPLSCKTVQ